MDKETLELIKNDPKPMYPSKYNPKVHVPWIPRFVENCVKEKKLPTIEGLCYEMNIDTDTLNNWRKAYRAVFGAVNRLIIKQKELLLSDGFYGRGKTNPSVGVFILRNNHGMKEDPTNLTQVNINQFGDLTDEQLDKVIAAKAKQVGVDSPVGGKGKKKKKESSQVRETTSEAD